MTRLYAPVTARTLDDLVRAGSASFPNVFGVTPALREALPDEDEEGLENVATQLAAASTSSDPVAVVAMEVRSGAQPAEADDALARFTVAGDVAMRDVVCFLVADPGERVSDEADLEMSWYDRTEADAVRALLG